ncbi:MAG: hypothetical protein AAFZ52_16025, partial [Bacteroidota bacterium]
DTLHPAKIRRQLAGRQPPARWIIGGYRNLLPDGSHFDNLPHSDPWKGLVYRYRIGYTGSNLYQRTLLTEVEGWNEGLPDNTDPDLHFRLLQNGAPYQLMADPLSYYHHHPAGTQRVSTGQPVYGNLRRVRLLRQVNDYLQSRQDEYWEKERAYFYEALLRALRILATHDLELATEEYRAALRNYPGLLQERAAGILPPVYRTCYRYFGFRPTEAMRRYLARSLPRTLLAPLKPK